MKETKGVSGGGSIFSMLIANAGSSENADKQMTIMEHAYSDYMNQIFEQLKQIEDILPRGFPFFIESFFFIFF